MKKIVVYLGTLVLAVSLLGANVSPVMAASDAKSTAELQIIDDGFVEPPAPPINDIPSGDVVVNPDPGSTFPNGPIDNLQNLNSSGNLFGMLNQSTQKVFPKTSESKNWWLIVIGIEVLLLVGLLYFNQKQSKEVWGGNADA